MAGYKGNCHIVINVIRGIKSVLTYKFVVYINWFSSNLDDRIFQFQEQSKVSGDYDRSGKMFDDNRIDVDLNGKFYF